MNNVVNFVIQGKGGVGKSVLATYLAQFFREELGEGQDLVLFDTDPVNKTFSKYKSLNVIKVELLKNKEINKKNFDELMEAFFNASDTTFLVDTGASTYLPLVEYFEKTSFMDLMREQGEKVLFHVPLTNDQSRDDTLDVVRTLSETVGADDQSIYLYENGWLSSDQAPAKLNLPPKQQKKVGGVVNIAKADDMTVDVIKDMLASLSTFDEFIDLGNVGLMDKIRIKKYRKNLFENFSRAFVTE